MQTGADGKHYPASSKMSNGEIKRYNKDASSLKYMADYYDKLMDSYKKVNQSPVVRVARDISLMYDKIAKEANANLSEFELRNKLIDQQTKNQIERDKKRRDSFERETWYGKVGGWTQRVYWDTSNLVENTRWLSDMKRVSKYCVEGERGFI